MHEIGEALREETMAQKVGKTEHSGAKKGAGASWERKADAKKWSAKRRREVGKKSLSENQKTSQETDIC